MKPSKSCCSRAQAAQKARQNKGAAYPLRFPRHHDVEVLRRDVALALPVRLLDHRLDLLSAPFGSSNEPLSAFRKALEGLFVHRLKPFHTDF